jgi:hypothetical protein
VSQDEERKKHFEFKRSWAPVDKQYRNYKTYEIKLDLSTGIEDSFAFRKFHIQVKKINYFLYFRFEKSQ